MNNLKVVTTTSDEYATTFGFTEPEVFEALGKCGLDSEKSEVKRWYDGFIFGEYKDIYNPWSILNYLDSQQYTTYWANTSANSLVGKLIREAGHSIKEQFELLLHGESIRSVIDEQIVYNQLNGSERAIWSMLLASGYLKVLHYEKYDEIPEGTQPKYELALTNLEVNLMFQNMIHAWFDDAEQEYNDFINALLENDVDAMNEYMNGVALRTFSSFDTGKQPSVSKPEKFYHGFVLGLLVDLQDHYYLTSNRESGFGRYDVMIEPKQPAERDAYIIEFKVFNARREKNLEDTVETALAQIREKKYVENLVERGISKEHIHCYAFAFEGKTVLIVGLIVTAKEVKMGLYLNPGNEEFRNAAIHSKIYVDKTEMIKFTNSQLFGEHKNICVSRPRRFGKSMAANMLSAYYSRECDSEKLFEGLEISKESGFKKHLNQYDTIF